MSRCVSLRSHQIVSLRAFLIAKRVTVFPHTQQLCDSGGVSYNSLQFLHCLSQGGIRPHRSRAQSPQTAPHHFQSPSQGQVATRAPGRLALNPGFPQHFCSLSSLKLLVELGETVYFLGDQLIMKGCNSGTAG